MKSKTSKRLVIDASVARAAGGESATFPSSKKCRDFLTSVLIVCHRFVMMPAVREEWTKHESRFAKQWRVSMVARRKLVFINVSDDVELRAAIESTAKGEKKVFEILKDLHLVEAAQSTDRTIISLDDAVRSMLVIVSEEILAIRSIIWVNPVKFEGMDSWLLKGAPALNELMIRP